MFSEFQKLIVPRHEKLVAIFLESRMYSSSKKDNGKIIKTLNKENKSLFGDLLETKSERRKRMSKTNLPKISNGTSTVSKHDWSSEIQWRERLNSGKPLNDSYTWSSVRHVRTEVSADVCKDTTKPVTSHLVSSASDNNGTNIFNKSNCRATHKTNHLCSVVPEENKVPVFQLPEIIVKNIPSFPLQNDKKQFSRDYCGEGILTVTCKEVVDQKINLYPSVSKILNATMSEGSRAALLRWRQKMIAELGPDEFLKYYKGLLTKGSLFHATVHKFLSGLPEERLQLDPAVEGCWHSLSSVMADIGSVYVLESHVVHSRLKYRGVIDCVALYQDKPVLIEWKKSDKQKSEISKTYDAPMQLAAYLGAMNYDERYSCQVKRGLVVVAYSDGSPAEVFPLNAADCNKYWKLWLGRVHQYWQLPNEAQL